MNALIAIALMSCCPFDASLPASSRAISEAGISMYLLIFLNASIFISDLSEFDCIREVEGEMSSVRQQLVYLRQF